MASSNLVRDFYSVEGGHTVKYQERTCRVGGHMFTHIAKPGRPPVVCEEHRMWGVPRPDSSTPVAPPVAVAYDPIDEAPIPVDDEIITPDVPEVPEVPGHPLVDCLTHKTFPDLLDAAMARVPAMLVGPAGTGKTTASRHLGKALNLPTYIKSCHPLMTSYDLMGYKDVKGRYHATTLRTAFEFGGVYLLDEVDASNPGILVELNNLASCEIGEEVEFCGDMIARHADFVLMAGANTYGDGASAEYVGREQLDLATLDRFATIDWDIDEAIERRVAANDSWVDWVQSVRKVVDAQKVNMLVSPRASINGAKLLRQGVDRRKVEKMMVWKGASDDVVRSVRSGLRVRQGA